MKQASRPVSVMPCPVPIYITLHKQMVYPEKPRATPRIVSLSVYIHARIGKRTTLWQQHVELKGQGRSSHRPTSSTSIRSVWSLREHVSKKRIVLVLVDVVHTHMPVVCC
jgi:hypothetical protein